MQVASPSTSAATDREALEALYRATGGDSWDNNDNWMSTAVPVDEWYGVTIDNSGRVIRLDLRYNGLSGSIPAELGDLANLISLDLRYNELSGSIPAELGNLTNLKWLDLDGNELSGSIPAELGNLTNLEWLQLRWNGLSGSIPAALGNLTNLERLYLWDNGLSGSIPAELGNLTNLERLYLGGNELTGSIPAALGNLANLTSLSLPWNGLSGSIPAALGNLTNLTWLALWSNDLSGSIPAELGNLTNLTELALSDNELSGSIPAELGNLTNLTELDLGSTELNGPIPAWLGNLTNLERLDLGWNEFSGSIPAALSNLANLTSLSLRGNVLSGPIPPELGNLTNLETLFLDGNELSGSIPAELGNLINLEELELDGNDLSGCVPAMWQYGSHSVVVIKTVTGGGKRQSTYTAQVELPYCDASSARSFATAGAVMDRKALEAFYQATGGDNWDENWNWPGDAPLGFWHGVSTDRNGQVIELGLGRNGLSGAIPPELGNLTDVTALSLGGNELSGAVPPVLANLTNLTSLSLSTNGLSGTIPPELGNLTNLTSLSLSTNELSGPIPPELANLTNLTSLYLSGNGLSGSIPPELGSLTDLTALYLSDNGLSGTIPPELANLTNLTSLYLGGNELSGCVPAVFLDVQHSDLHRLNLPFCEEGAPPPQLPTERQLGTTRLSAQWDLVGPQWGPEARSAEVRLSWEPVPGARGYVVLRRDGEASEHVAISDELPATATSYTDGELTEGESYEYVVDVKQSGGEGTRSNGVRIEIPSDLSGVPEKLTLWFNLFRWPDMAMNGIYLQWRYTFKAYHALERRVAGGEWELVDNFHDTDRHWDKNLEPGQYEYRVRCTNGCGREAGPWSNVVQARVEQPDVMRTPRLKSRQPPILGVQRMAPTRIPLAWSYVEGATSYEVQRCFDTWAQKFVIEKVITKGGKLAAHKLTAGISWVVVQIIEVAAGKVLVAPHLHHVCTSDWDVRDTGDIITETSYTDGGVSPGVYVYYRVRGWNAAGPGDWSNVVQVQPGVPNLYLTNVTENSVTLVWEGVEGVNAYEIDDCGSLWQLLMRCGSSWEHRPNASRDFYTKKIDDLTPGRDYALRIRTHSDAGPSDWSNVVKVRPGAPFQPPALNARGSTNEDAFEVDLAWDRVRHATEYEVRLHESYYGTLDSFKVSGPEYTHSIVETIDKTINKKLSTNPREDAYAYSVRGINAYGEGPWSSWVKCVPADGTCQEWDIE